MKLTGTNATNRRDLSYDIWARFDDSWPFSFVQYSRQHLQETEHEKKSIPYFGTGTRFPSEMCLGEWQERDESIENLTEQISYRNTCLSGSKLKLLLVWLICHMYVQINPWGAAVIVKSKNRLSFVSTCREGYEVFNVFDIWSPSCARWSLVCFNARKCHTENPRFYMCIDMFHRVICTSTMVDFVPLESQEPPVEIILHVWKRREQKKQARALFYS